MSLTLIIIILTGLISMQAFNNPNVRGQLIFHPVTIRETGQWYRFLTHGLIHGDLQHLLINMFVLWQFGTVIEDVFMSVFGGLFGRLAFVFLYFSAIVVASVSSYFKHRYNYGYSAVGASGATSALVFSYILFAPWQWFIFPPLPAILFGVAYLWYSSYMEKRGMDNIGHNAHFWGAVYGAIFTLVALTLARPEFLLYFIAELAKGPSMPSFLN
jgi:membrane associated rhomboid family serine protease